MTQPDSAPEKWGVWCEPEPEKGSPNWVYEGDRTAYSTGSQAEMQQLAEDMRRFHPKASYEARPYPGVASKPPAAAPTASPSMTEDFLARLLFETDKTVLAVIEQVDDCHLGRIHLAHNRLLERAWARDEAGRRAWAEATAAAVFARFRRYRE